MFWKRNCKIGGRAKEKRKRNGRAEAVAEFWFGQRERFVDKIKWAVRCSLALFLRVTNSYCVNDNNSFVPECQCEG